MKDLGQYANCQGCGVPFSVHDGASYGYRIAPFKFKPDGVADHRGPPLHNGYFCGECARVALNAALRGSPKGV